MQVVGWKEQNTLVANAKLRILKTNFVVTFSFKYEQSLIETTKSFYSSQSFEVLFDKIVKTFPQSDDDQAILLRIRLTDKVQARSKVVYKKVMIGKDVLAEMQGFKEAIIKKSYVVDVISQRYKVGIRNCSSANSDFKSLQIICEDEVLQVVVKLKRAFYRIIKENTDQSIVFDNDKTKSTHRIVVQKGNGRAECFSIRFPNFSSQEVCDLLVKKIKGGNYER